MEDEKKVRKNDWGHEETTYLVPSNPEGKIDLGTQVTFFLHRSGWDYAMRALKPMHNDDGVYFHGFLEDIFCWNYSKHKRDKTIPFDQPWTGFFHNPPNMPKWFSYKNSPQTIFANKTFQESLGTCVGLFTLSESHAEFIRKETSLPVSSIIHPTEIPELLFNFDAFKQNKRKRILNIGYWLRKINSIYMLPSDESIYKKTRVMPFAAKSHAMKTLGSFSETEKNHSAEHKSNEKLYGTNNGETETLNMLPDEDYDVLLSENIVFLDMYDSSANNAIIESIARATPVLTNPLPSITEYLGRDYPFYFNTLEEAAKKASDFKLIEQTHQYLLECDTRKKLTPESFRKALRESEVYSLL